MRKPKHQTKKKKEKKKKKQRRKLLITNPWFDVKDAKYLQIFVEKAEKEVGGWLVKHCVTVTWWPGLAELESVRAMKTSFSLWWYWNGDERSLRWESSALLKREILFEMRELCFTEERSLKWKSWRKPLKRASKVALHVNCSDCGTKYVVLFTEMPLKTELWKLKTIKMYFQFP